MKIELRDLLAAAALAGGLGQEAREEPFGDAIEPDWWYEGEALARRAYEIADAMLKVRNE